MNPITVIATIKAKPKDIDFVKAQLCALVRPTRRERGCLKYGFYQDRDDPSLFNSYERWTSKRFIDKHLESSHIKQYLKATKNSVEVFEIRYFDQICK